MLSKTEIRKGFTLVELAIVMTIIGLLIGGILKGQELLENARVTSTIAQFKSYEAAVTAFRDVYDVLPGDGMPDAVNRLPGCNENCNTPVTGREKNGLINAFSFEESLTGRMNLPHPPDSLDDEATLFWIHLLKANLIAGMSDEALTDSSKTGAGYIFPSAKLAYGFIAGSSANWGLTTDAFMEYNYIVLVGPIDNNAFNIEATTGNKAVTPARAAQIDRKIDDGKPLTGSVVSPALRLTTCHSAFNSSYDAPNYSEVEYLESNPSKDCVVSYRIK